MSHQFPTATIKEIKTSIIASIDAGDFTPTMILGQPGQAKSALALQISEHYGIPASVANQLIFRPSLHDPVDLTGIPVLDPISQTAKFSGVKFIALANAVAKKHGIAIIVWDELAQAVPMMQNAINGLLLDRRLNDQELHPKVFQIATGNRVEDRAGSGRLLTHTANRMEVVEVEFSLQDWMVWAAENTSLDPIYYAHFSFRPEAINDFDASRTINATPRSWASMEKIPLPTTGLISRRTFQTKLAGRVGVGRASEFCSFLDIYEKLPDVDETIAHPDTAQIPDDPSTLYALAGALASRANDSNIKAILHYGDRLLPEFSMALLHSLISRAKKGGFAQTKEFIQATIKAFDLIDPNAGKRNPAEK